MKLRLALLLLAFPISTILYGQVIDKIVPINRTFYDIPAPGMTFVTPVQMDSANYPAALAILDEEGFPVFYKPFAKQGGPPYASVMVTDFKLQPSGLLSYGIPMPPDGMKVYLLDSNFVKVDSITTINDVATDSHDFIHLPDGSYHLVGTEERTMDCSSLHTVNGQTGSTTATVEGNVIQRFNANKELEFEWRSLDYFNLDDVYSHYFTNPNYLDHSHYNSIEIDTDGNYLLSFRHLHEVTKIDANTGDIIWRLGGKSGMFIFEGDTMPFSAQHDARRIENGNLTIFDNGLHNSTPGARAIEYQLDEDNFIATAVWQYAEPNGFPSMFIGSMRRQPNGNSLIDWGGAFPLSQSNTIVEVDASGNVVMELDFADSLFISYRAVKEQLPFALPRPEIACDNNSKTLTASDGYPEYEWSTGAQSQSIVVEDTGTYQVWVRKGIGYFSSEIFHVTDMENICGQVSIVESSSRLWQVYPNPASDKVFVRNAGNDRIDDLTVFNHLGQIVKHILHPNNMIQVSDLEPGLYFIQISSEGTTELLKLVVSR